ISGVVVDANGSSRLEEGQPVYLTGWDIGFAGGLYAQYVVARDTAPWPLPAGTDLDAAAALMNYIVAKLMMDFGARGAETRSVLLHGVAGGMGTALSELARAAGALVIGTAGSDEKCEFARARGVVHVINYRAENVADRVLDITSGRGVDIIYNHMAGNSFADDLKMIAPLGLIVSYAALNGMPDENLFRQLRGAINRAPSIRVIGTHAFEKLPAMREAAFRGAIDLLATRRIEPATTMRFALSDAGRAHELMESRRSTGKILLKP
ncbi:MAG TPA: zinc-binding dehydrogenase, partial [Burkholderiaceae bacterium]|nr:zinc-binding dehydrogenase [Burkholderiaceae bacterium]